MVLVVSFILTSKSFLKLLVIRYDVYHNTVIKTIELPLSIKVFLILIILTELFLSLRLNW